MGAEVIPLGSAALGYAGGVRVRASLFGGGVAAALALGAFSAQADEGSLEQVGRHDLGGRGLNAALAIADHCAYIGSRSDDPPLILDISDPTHPEQVGELPAHAGSTSRELRVAPAAHLLVVMHYALGGAANQLDFYRWDGDCRRPAPAGRYSFGDRRPHEFYLWQDPAKPDRVLLFVTIPRGPGRNLEVIDASNPASPVMLAGWPAPASLAGGANLHSIALSEDGRTAYLSLWTGGLLLADASDFPAGAPRPALRLITPVAGALRYPPGNVHSAVPVPGRSLVVTTDEAYLQTGCPYGWARLVDVADPAQPRVVGGLQAPENDLTRCRSAPTGSYTSHNPTLTPHLALISWYSAGLQVFDVSDATRPERLAQFWPQGATPRRRDGALGGTSAMTWSYPILRDGLIYIVDINQGLRVLRYRGRHEEEITETVFSEGNSNLTRLRPSPSPPASPLATAAATLSTPSPPPTPIRRAFILWLIVGAAGGTLGLLVALAWALKVRLGPW